MATAEELAAILERRRLSNEAATNLRGPEIPETNQALTAVETGRELGLPPQAVVGQPVYDQVAQTRRDQRILQNSPRLKSWLTNSMNAAIGRDQINDLSALEKGSNAFYRGALNVNAGLRSRLAARNLDLEQFVGKSREEIQNIVLPRNIQRQWELAGLHFYVARAIQDVNEIEATVHGADPGQFLELAEAHLEAIGAIRSEASQLKTFEASDRIRTALEPVRSAETFEDQLLGALTVFADSPTDTLTFFGETVLESAVPIAAGAVTTMATRNPSAGIGVMGLSSGVAEYSSMVDGFLMQNGIDLRTEEGRRLLLQNPDLMRQAEAKGVAKGLVVGILDAISGGIAGQQLAASPVGDLIIQSFIQASLGGAGEALGSLAAGEEVNAVDVLIEAMVEIAVTAPEVSLVAGRSILKDTRNATVSGRTREGLINIDRIVSKLPLANSSPEIFSDVTEALGLDDGSILVNAETVMTYFQDANQDPSLFGIDPVELEEQTIAGGEITISLADYVKSISGTEHATFFQEQSKLSDEELSPAELSTLKENLAGDVEDAVDQITKATGQSLEARTSEQKVQSEIERQLLDVGRPPSVALAEAQLTSAFHATMADFIGTTAENVLNQFPLRVERGSFSAWKNDSDFNQTEKGSITFQSDGEAIIRLTETADLSTYIHEAGHYFLQVFSEVSSNESAPTELTDMLKTINEFIGHTEGQYSTQSQEKWARAFETYAMEGNAPSIGLRDAFVRFKHWLLRIYRTLVGTGVRINPTIRDVMDRMLATSEQIELARSEQHMRPLFDAPSPVGMTEAEFGPYQRLARRAVEEANTNLLEKMMKRIRRERENQFKKDKASIREIVETEINDRPVYRMIELLTNGRWIGEDNVDDLPDLRLDRQSLIDRFGKEIIGEIDRSKIGGKRSIYKSEGSDLGFVAETFGFETIEAMVDALRNAGKRKDRIDADVDRVMTEMFGDPLNDGSIEEEAMQAVHGEQQASVTAAELRVLTRRSGGNPRTSRAVLVRERARGMIGRMRVVDAARPQRFLNIERRAARDAQRAFAKVISGKDPESALESARRFKEQQLLNHYLYLEARRIEHEVDRGRTRMRNYAKDSVRKKIGQDYMDQIDALLDQFEFRKLPVREIERRASLQRYVEKMIEEGREGELDIDPRLLDDARRIHYTRMSVDELRGLFDTISNIDHMGRHKTKLVDRRRTRDLHRSIDNIVGKLRETHGTGKSKKVRSIGANFMSALYTPDAMLAHFDQEEFGPIYDELKRSIDEGAATEQEMSVELADKFHGLFDRYSRRELRAMQTAKVVDGGNGHAWAKLEILALALNTGNADNRQRIFDQTIHDSRRLNEGQANALLDTLDKRDWEFVQAMWDLIDSYWPRLAAVEKRRTGLVPKKVEATPVVTKFGTFKGGYYPIKYDNTLPGSKSTDVESEMDKRRNAMFGPRAAVNNRMTKERQKAGGGRPIDYSMNVPFAHLRDTVRLINIGEAVDNTAKLLNHKRVRDAFLEAGLKIEYDQLKLWIGDTASGPIQNSDAFNSFFRGLKTNFTLMALGFNIKTMALQLTGFGQSAVTIGKKNMLRGLWDYTRNPVKWVEYIRSVSPFMRERASTFQKDIYDFMNDVSLNTPVQNTSKRAKAWVAKAAFAPITFVQFYGVDLPTWIGAYHQALRDGHDVTEAAHRADRLVERSQGGHLISDRAAVERGTVNQNTVQSDFVKIFTTLGGYMLRKMNRGVMEVGRGTRAIRDAETNVAAVGEAVNMTSNLLLLYVLEAGLIVMAQSLMAEDPEDEEIAKLFAWELSMAVVGGVPLVRDVTSPLAGFGGGGIYGSVTEMPARIITQFGQGEADVPALKAALSAVGILTGFPSVAFSRVLEFAMDDKGQVTPAEALLGRNPLDE